MEVGPNASKGAHGVGMTVATLPTFELMIE